MAMTMMEWRLGRRRNDDGNDLVFLGNNQLWSNAFAGGGGLGDFYNDDGNEDDYDGNNDGGDHCRWQRLGRQRNNDGNDLVFLGNNQPWSDAFLAEGGLGEFYDDDDDEDDGNGDDDEGDHCLWQRIGWLRNNDGDDLIFFGNNQPLSDAFLAAGGVGDFYNDDYDDDDEDCDDDEGDHHRWRRYGWQRNDDGDDLFF